MFIIVTLMSREDLDLNEPLTVIQTFDPYTGTKGVLVIDTLILSSGGGVRMIDNINIEEIKQLARTMTFKHAILGLPIGGAKAGIWAKPARSDKEKIVRAFGQSISHLVQKRHYLPGEDMGTTMKDINIILNCAGLKGRKINGESSMSIGVSSTGYGVSVAAMEALRSIGLDFSGARVAIEGFGRVGSQVAWFMNYMGAKIVALSTLQGAIYKPEGLNITNLLQMRNKIGDSVIQYCDTAEYMKKEKIFDLSVDLLVPCARTHVINEKNADNIKARVVCPGANVPLTNGAESILYEKGIISVPDFIANSGGVISSLLVFPTVSEMLIYRIVGKTIQKITCDNLRTAYKEGESPRKIAVRTAKKRYIRMKKWIRRPLNQQVVKMLRKIRS